MLHDHLLLEAEWGLLIRRALVLVRVRLLPAELGDMALIIVRKVRLIYLVLILKVLGHVRLRVLSLSEIDT